MNDTIIDLRRKRERLIQEKDHCLYLGKDFDKEIAKIDSIIADINGTYLSLIKANVDSLTENDLEDYLKENDISLPEAKVLILNSIKERNNDDYENFYNTLLFLKENGIKPEFLDKFREDLATIAFAKKTKDYIYDLEEKDLSKKDTERYTKEIECLRKDIVNNEKIKRSLTFVFNSIDESRDSMKDYNTTSLESEIFDLEQTRSDMYQTRYDNDKNRKAFFALEDEIDKKRAAKVKIEKELKEQVNTIWANLSPLDKENFINSHFGKQFIKDSIESYIKSNSKESAFIITLDRAINRSKQEIAYISLKKRIAETKQLRSITSPIKNPKEAYSNQKATIQEITHDYPFLMHYSTEELENYSKAGVTTTTILATPKDKKKTK